MDFLDELNLKYILEVMATLRQDSRTCPRTGEAIRALMHKYDMLIIGKDFNTIYARELCHCLNTKFDMQISADELMQKIPLLCDTLGMTYEPMRALDDLSNPVPADYQIALY